MAHLFKNLFILFGFCIILATDVFAFGRDATIFLKDGRKKKGELLIVRDSVIAITTGKIENTNFVVQNPELIEFAFVRDIDRVKVHEIEVEGAISGALAGAGAGVMYGVLTPPDKPYVNGEPPTIPHLFESGLIGAVSGMVIGWAIATLSSEDEMIIRPTSIQALITIKQHARFENGEPGFIRDFIDDLLKKST